MPLTDRAWLDGQKADGTYKWCVYPCQKLKENGERIVRKCRVAIDPNYQGKVWQLSGTTESPTLSPSIDCDSKPCWHGFIINGEVQP